MMNKRESINRLLFLLNQIAQLYKQMPIELGQKYITQIKIGGKKEFFPNKYYSSWEFLEELRKVVKGRFDIDILEVKYCISKSKGMKEMDEGAGFKDLEINHKYNKVFGIGEDFMEKFIMEDVVELTAPKDFDPNVYDEQNQLEKKKEEEKRFDSINEKLAMIIDLYEGKKVEDVHNLNKFKQSNPQSLAESEVDIFVKVILSEPVEAKIEAERNSKKPLIICPNNKQECRIYLHTNSKAERQQIDQLTDMSYISNWSLGTSFEKNKNSFHFFDTKILDKNVGELSKSTKITSFINLWRNNKRNLESIEIYSFLFNETVIKASISLAQIKKIQKYTTRFNQKQGNKNIDEYFLYLTYPPKYYIHILRNDEASDDRYIKNWDRVENFFLLRNKNIQFNDFSRLFLFNNTIVKISLNENDTISTEVSRQKIESLIDQFKGNIKMQLLHEPFEFKYPIQPSTFNYTKGFVDRLKFITSAQNSKNRQKIWKIKYLCLVMLRFNYMTPQDIIQLIAIIEEKIQDLDVYIYILWRTATSMWGYVPLSQSQKFLDYVLQEYKNLKALGISEITKKLSANTHFIAFVFKASLTPSGYIFNPPTPEMKGRLMKELTNESEFFLRVSVSDDNDGSLKNQKYITKYSFRKTMNEIEILGRKYIPLGWSPSQLRSFSIWYVSEFTEESKEYKRLTRQYILSFLGDFDSIQNPAKKAARIGQNFSASWTFQCKNVNERKIDDVRSSKGHLFTDGIGKISKDLLQKICLRLQIRQLSILQIRYKGAKGVLVLDSNLPNNTIQLRPSMIKFECSHDAAKKYLDILDWNKYKAGFLNRQIIILLKTLGIHNSVFERLQQIHIDDISKLSFKDCSIFKHMNEELNTDINNLEPANITILHLLRAGFLLEEEPFFRGVLETMKKNGYHKLKTKSSIRVKESARIIGVIDEYQVLQEKQLFCSVYDMFDEDPHKETIDGDVIITRNPCLHPADIRKMKCVGMAEIQKRFEKKGIKNHFEHYVNCVIFPMKGDIPITSQISGSDLDGDNFFICWDRTLIPKEDQPYYLIDEPIALKDESKIIKKQKRVVSYTQMLDFFIEYLNYQKLGQIDNSHLVHADQSEVFTNDKVCIELAKIHGKAVDFPKTGFCPLVDPKLLVKTYPDFMQKNNQPEYYSKSILGILYRDIKQKIQNLLADKVYTNEGKIDKDLINEIKFDFTDLQIIDTVKILLQYQKDLFNLINLVGVDTEYEIYSGNFTIAKEEVSSFGKNRLIASILSLKSKYFDLFFDELPEDDKVSYMEAHQKMLEKVNLFSEVTLRKGILFYLISYIMKFPQLKHSERAQFQILKQTVEQKLESMNIIERERKYCGFVWFVFPKIITNKKHRTKTIQKIKLEKGKQDQNDPNGGQADIIEDEILKEGEEQI